MRLQIILSQRESSFKSQVESIESKGIARHIEGMEHIGDIRRMIRSLESKL